MRYFVRRLSAAAAVVALAACSGGLGMAPSSSSSLLPIPARGAHATSVLIVVRDAFKRLPGIPVQLYTGKYVDSCPPLGFPCIKKEKSLAKGTTRKNGQITLQATFSSSQNVCAEAVRGGNTTANCERPFPTSIVLQFK